MTPHTSVASSTPPLPVPVAHSAHLQPSDGWLTDPPDSSFNDLGTGTTACGMPAERHARSAAQRAFVALKLSFLYVADGLPGQTELQRRVRMAEEPHDLWTLRASVFAALTGDNPQHRSRRQLINRSLDTVFACDSPPWHGSPPAGPRSLS